MKNILLFLFYLIFLNANSIIGFNKPDKGLDESREIIKEQFTVPELINYLNKLSQNSDNNFFKIHCRSIIDVINSRQNLSLSENSFLEELYTAFKDSNMLYYPGKLSSYLERQRPFIVSWVSTTDGATSLAWLIPPENWEPEKSYPLYVRLHGLYSPYSNPIEYMTTYLRSETLIQATFNDGYTLYPWGRGNLWYEGISEKDIWEGISSFESIAKVDQLRMYLLGHSMGGYGAWAIGQKSPDIWAGLGIYAGALWYSNYNYLNAAAVQKIKNIPVYIVCGDQDGLLGDNQTAYNLLQDAGNENIFFTTFSGGHVSLLENWQNMYNWLKQWTNDKNTSVDEKVGELNFRLYNNYPNPFNPATEIQFTIPSVGTRRGVFVQLKIYDILGNEVATLVNEEKPAGIYQVKFDTGNLCSGIYFYRLNADNFAETKKMVLMR